MLRWLYLLYELGEASTACLFVMLSIGYRLVGCMLRSLHAWQHSARDDDARVVCASSKRYFEGTEIEQVSNLLIKICYAKKIVPTVRIESTNRIRTGRDLNILQCTSK